MRGVEGYELVTSCERRGAELGTVLLLLGHALWFVGWLPLIARGDRQCTKQGGDRAQSTVLV